MTENKAMLLIQRFAHKNSNNALGVFRDMLYKLQINTSYDEGRMLFRSESKFPNKSLTPLKQECNGVILERNTWKPLVVPPRTLRNNIETKTSNKFLYRGMYKIYKAEDGTCINMYNYNGKWCISTAKGYEMNDVKWETKTYRELLDDCLSVHGLTWGTFTEQLNPEFCYSFGFRHTNFHKFRNHLNEVNKLWFIQSVNLNETDPHYLWVSSETVANLPTQEEYGEHVESLRDLYQLAANAYKDYLDNGNVCYGFILRSINFHETVAHSDLLIESSLLIAIRKIWYDNAINNYCRNHSLDKELVIPLNAYLTHETKERMEALFPQYKSLFAKFDNVVKTLVQYSIATVNGTKIENSQEAYEQAATDFLASLELGYDLRTKNVDQQERILMECLLHFSSLEILTLLIMRLGTTAV